MRSLGSTVTIVVMLPLVHCISDFGEVNGEEKVRGNHSNTTIELTSVPPYGSFKNLSGRVQHVNPEDHKIAVYIYVSGWWTKPRFDEPLTSIERNGRWQCDITTGGADQNATRISAFLVPKGYDPPLMSGGSALPRELFQNSVAHIEAQRMTNTDSETLSFSDYEWIVKSSDTVVGPGPNYFSDSAENVWVDKQGQLHLKITERDGKWRCAEVVSKKSLGYGRYLFYLSSRADQLDENAILGLFTWDNAPEYNHREIDIEFSKWGQEANDNSQFVVQPWNRPENIHRFNTQLNGDYSTHSFDWRKGNIRFQSLYGHRAIPLGDSHLIASWNYTGDDIPVPGNENARINLWLLRGNPPSDNREIEVLIHRFQFVPWKRKQSK